MCGRFTLAVENGELEAEFPGVEFPSTFSPRYNIAPSQPVLVIPNDGSAKTNFMLWGLIPSWAKDDSIGNKLINARAETLSEKPAFRSSYKYKRCLILADGFYEWKVMPGSKTKIPHYVQLERGRPFSFAGLWSEWRAADGSSVRTCAIITTTPNELMASIHSRMPAILAPQDRAPWLDAAPKSPRELEGLIRPYPSDRMRAYTVSTLVNSPSVDRAECILPA